QDTKEVINRKLELGRMINRLKNPKYRAVLRMTYINKGTADSVCYDLNMSRTTYYRLKNEAVLALEEVI
ncbi:phage protein, partial [Streptococcus pneumoniae 845]